MHSLELTIVIFSLVGVGTYLGSQHGLFRLSMEMPTLGSGLFDFAFTSHMIVRNVIGHAGVELFPKRWLQWPIARLITTTTHHDLHHSEFRWNYGLYFTWWDRLVGTEHPQYRERFLASVSNDSTNDEIAGKAGISGA